MSAGFLKRMFSSVVDIIMVISVIYLTFTLIGQPLLQKRTDNFTEINYSYTEIMNAYNEELNTIQTEYNANMELAGDDTTLQAEAQDLYSTKMNMLTQQNNIDIQPYQLPISVLFISYVYYFIIGFAVIMTIYTLVLRGRTFGRKLMKIELEGNVNVFTVFYHDILFKYFFILLVLAYNPYYGIIFLTLALFVDIFLISFTGKRNTIRDMLLKIKVVKIEK